MPKKKDGMLFELLPRPTKGEDGQPLLYAHPAIGFKYTMEAIDEYCLKYRGMPHDQMAHLFEGFLSVAAFLMRDGSRVETPIGSFAPKLKLNGDFTDPEKVKGDNLSLGGIEFIPSKRFIKELEKYLDSGFRRKREVVERHPVTDAKELEEVLERCLKPGYTTVRTFSIRSGMKYRSAKRYLDGLCKSENPRIRRYMEGTTMHYAPIVKKEVQT